MIVSIIAAVAENNAIGKDNDLIWSLPRDMRFFRETTMGHYIIMGRRNFESIPHRFRPLPGRTNVVVTRQDSFDAPGAKVVNSIGAGLQLARDHGDEEVFIIGGGQIYELALELDLVDRMYITHVHASFEGDVFFPKFDESKWEGDSILSHEPDEKHEFGFEIVSYSRPLSQ